MGSYKCQLATKLKPKSHDVWHHDMFSYVCPVLRDEIKKAITNKNYKRLKKLLDMGVKEGQIKL